MEQLRIERPFMISMTVNEKEDYLPSFKVDFKCRISHPTGTFSYEANDIWFQCSVWDKFMEQLLTMDQLNCEALLSSLNDYLSIRLIRDLDDLSLVFKFKEVVIVQGSIDAETTMVIDFDTLAHIRESFNSFEKWW